MPNIHGHIASDDCSFCGAECGHSYKGVRIDFGIENENGALVLENTCGDLSWICPKCWGKIKAGMTLKQFMKKYLPEEQKRREGKSVCYPIVKYKMVPGGE